MVYFFSIKIVLNLFFINNLYFIIYIEQVDNDVYSFLSAEDLDESDC